MAKINKLIFSSKLDHFNNECDGICDLIFEHEQMKDKIFNSYIYLLEQHDLKQQIMDEFPESCFIYIYNRKFMGKFHLTVSHKPIDLKKENVNNIVLLGKIKKNKDKFAPIRNYPIKSYLNTNYLVKEHLKKKTNCDIFNYHGKKCKKYVIRNNDVLELNESCNIDKAVIVTTDKNEIDIKDYVHMYRKCITFNDIHCKKDNIEKIVVITSTYDGIFDNANKSINTHNEDFYKNNDDDEHDEHDEQSYQKDNVIHSNFDLTLRTNKQSSGYIKPQLQTKTNNVTLHPNSIQKRQRLFNSHIVRNGNSFMMGFNNNV